MLCWFLFIPQNHIKSITTVDPGIVYTKTIIL